MRIIPFLTVALPTSWSLVALLVRGDCYMHNPRGSNDRNCEENQARTNGNRLFDSQNNDNGGYSCPLARPFACYKLMDATERNACNQKNAVNPSGSMLNMNGVIDPTGTVTPRMYYYEGSQLTIEWTNQHGCGDNPRMECNMVLQYACEDTLTDDCGDPTLGTTCGPRDGFPVTNSDQTGDNGLNKEATDTIPADNTNGAQSDLRYGRHETLDYYTRCKKRARNKGLFLADRNLNGNTAIYTRQNNNGERHGLECVEERDYYPYWHDSPWKDIAYLTSDLTQCQTVPQQSQNVMPKNECVCPTCTGDIPNNIRDCSANGGTWKTFPAYNLNAPFCGPVDTTRENQLGNPVGTTLAGLASHFNWTIPTGVVAGQTCILRIRYNISTIDQNKVDIVGDAQSNGFFSPLKDRTNSEPKAYKHFSDITDPTLWSRAALGLAMNTNQYSRTFEDRSYTFSIRAAPNSGECKGRKIYNLNVRGKRGNIVQVYPSVEFDFIPNSLYIADTDCIHIQWTGSDYNPDRQPNNGYGGPASPLDTNTARSERHNLVQVPGAGYNEPVSTLAAYNMFDINTDQKMNLMFIGQNLADPNSCLNITEIKTNFPTLDQNGRDRLYLNCGKLSGALTPYFDGGLVRPASVGTFHYMSTRDNSFTNRDMKGVINVAAGASSPAVVGGLVGSVVGLGLIGLGALVCIGKIKLPKREAKVKRDSGNSATPVAKGGLLSSFTSKSGAKTAEKPLDPPKEAPKVIEAAAVTATAAAVAKPTPASPKAAEKTTTAVALYNHDASEPGELTFKKGDKITVLKKDESGWWEGSVGKNRGLFPANYVKEN